MYATHSHDNVTFIAYTIVQASVTAELTTDEDRDVQAAARIAQSKLSAIEPIIDGVTKQDSPADVEDRLREEQEKNMQMTEDAERDNDRRLGLGRTGPVAVKPRIPPRIDATPPPRPIIATRTDNRNAPMKPLAATVAKPDITAKSTQATTAKLPIKAPSPAPSNSRRSSRPSVAPVKPTSTVTSSISPQGMYDVIGLFMIC